VLAILSEAGIVFRPSVCPLVRQSVCLFVRTKLEYPFDKDKEIDVG